jgi:hypothetical protein
MAIHLGEWLLRVVKVETRSLCADRLDVRSKSLCEPSSLRGPPRRSFDGDLDQGKTNRPTPLATIKLALNTIRFRSQSN